MSDLANKHLYYDLGRLLSYNKFLNISIGARGRGKSYAAKKWAINGWLKNRKQFIYLRRYKTEFENIKNYFSDIEDIYEGHTFKVEKGYFYIDDEIAGYYIPLSTSQQNKSNSYPDVDKIIFDEFIIDKGRVTYLKGEVQLFLDMIETVLRMRDDSRVLMISNAISSVNPYFIYFNLFPRDGDKFICKDEIVLQIDKNDTFIQHKQQTKFGKLIKDTAYGKYAIENEFLRDNKSFIESMSGQSVCWYGLKYESVTYSVWYNQPTGYVYISKKDVPSTVSTYAITTADHNINMIILNKSDKLFKNLKLAYEYGQVRFDTLQSKAAFLEIMNFL